MTMYTMLSVSVYWKMFLTFRLTFVEDHDSETIWGFLFFQTWIIPGFIKPWETSLRLYDWYRMGNMVSTYKLSF